MFRSLWKWFRGWLTGGPHFVVGPAHDPYLLRWYILPRNPLFNIYVHKFLRDDDDRAMHDHPWPSMSVLVRGRYIEQTSQGRREYGPGSVLFRGASYTHRVELIDCKPCWTLFITGPRVREWGFHCPQGWVHWKKFVTPGNPGEVGRGCEQ